MGNNEVENILSAVRKRLLSLFDSIDAKVYVADMDSYQILYANPALERMFGTQPRGEICYEALHQRQSNQPAGWQRRTVRNCYRNYRDHPELIVVCMSANADTAVKRNGDLEADAEVVWDEDRQAGCAGGS